MKNSSNTQYEVLTNVVFHGGSVEQINEEELIRPVTFHGGSVEQICEEELIRPVTFHVTVWACTNDKCGAIFNSDHNGVCPECGCKLEKQRREHEAPED